MVDDSGSTATTDPSCKYRCSTLESFIGSYGSNTNLTYSFSYFSSDVTEWDMSALDFLSAGTNTLHPFGSSSGLSSAVTYFSKHVGPGGDTGYGEAFSAMETIISNDEAAGNTENYVVVFMSDGQPTDITCTSGSGRDNDCVANAAITTLVKDLLKTSSANGKSQATVSAVFFGSASDSDSVSNLTTMASVGGGQFVNANVNSNIVINDIITVPGCSASPSPSASPTN
jgi:hypothetical protein